MPINDKDLQEQQQIKTAIDDTCSNNDELAEARYKDLISVISEHSDVLHDEAAVVTTPAVDPVAEKPATRKRAVK